MQSSRVDLQAALRRIINLPRRNLPDKPGWIASRKDALSALQSLVTILALVAAGAWFFGQHTSSDKLKLEFRPSHRSYIAKPGSGDANGEQLLGVEIWISNTGQSPVYLEKGKFRVDDVNPNDETIANCFFTAIIAQPGYCDATETTGPVISISDRIRARTLIGWLWPPKAHAWIEPGQTHQYWMGKFRLWPQTRTVQLTLNIKTIGGEWENMTVLYDVTPPLSETLKK